MMLPDRISRDRGKVLYKKIPIYGDIFEEVYKDCYTKSQNTGSRF